jgi:hypothetical protein
MSLNAAASRKVRKKINLVSNEHKDKKLFELETQPVPNAVRGSAMIYTMRQK